MAQRFLSNIKVNDAYTLPASDGTDGQVISTDGAGTLTFADAAASDAIEITVKNVSGGSLTVGTVITPSPSANPPAGNVLEVIAADNSLASTMPAIGVLKATLADDAEGSAIAFGHVSGFDTSSFTAGDSIYVNTSGGFTTTKPTGTKFIQKIGIVVKSHASSGSIKVFGANRTNDVPTPLYIDHSNQRLGIGTTTPGYKLEVDGSAAVDSLTINGTDVTATATEINVLDGIPSTLTAAELGYVDGVTSAIQTQLNAKQATVSGAASTIVSANLTPSRVIQSSGSGKVVASNVTSTELSFLDGVTSSIQTQLNNKVSNSEVDPDIKTLSLPANTTISAFGKSLIDDADASAARATLGIDAAGTDNSTDVTLAGSLDYISIDGQVITRNAIDLSTDVTGTLPVGNMAATALTTVQTAANQTAHLALTAQEGDVVVRSDENKTYMHNGGTAGTMADYTLLATPTDAVTSVNGNTGVVTVVENVTTNLSTTANDTSLTINSSDGQNASIPAATTSAWGAMTDEDKTKLDGIATNATANTGTVDTSGTPVDNDFAKFTDANTIEGRSASETRSDLGLGSLATLSSVNASTITDNSVGAAELNVSGNGSTSQFLRSDGDGTFTWATPTNTNTTYSTSTAYGTTISGTQIRLNGGEIAGGVDLNTMRTQGVFSQNSNSDAVSGSNYPEDKAGVLTVDDDMYGNGYHTHQMYSIYNSQNIYSRSYYNGSWTSWRNLAQDTNTQLSNAQVVSALLNQNVDLGTGYLQLGQDTEHRLYRSATSLVKGTTTDTTILTGRTLDLYSYDDINLRAGNSDKITFTAAAAGNQMVIDGNGVNINEYLRHNGDTNTHLRFVKDKIILTAGSLEMMTLTEGTTDSIVFNEGSADIDFRVESNNNANMLFVDGGNDRVGIGTGSPGYKLHVEGSVALGVMPGHESEGSVRIGRYDGNTSRYNDIKSYVSSTESSNYLKFSVHGGVENATEDVMTLKGNGNVGIGTTSPEQKLHIEGNIYMGPNNTNNFIHSGADLGLQADGEVKIVSDVNDTSGGGASDIIFGYGSSTNTDSNKDFTEAELGTYPRVEIMRIDASSNRVGIGTVSPGYKLEVAGKIASNTGFHSKASQGVMLSAGSGADTAVISNGWSSGVGDWLKLEVPSADNEGGTLQLNSNGRVGIGTTSPAVSLDINATDAIALPTGTTAQRPSNPAAGMFRYNTTNSEFEGYTTSWGAIGGSGGGGGTTNVVVDTFSGDGSDRTFDITNTIADEDNVQVYIDGVYQSKSNYSTSGTTITFSTDATPPSGTNNIEVTHFVQVNGDPSIEVDTFSGNSSTTVFTLTTAPVTKNNLQIYIDGVYQAKANYSVSGTSLTFGTAPGSGTNNIEVTHLKIS